jgi:hypothetical protein
MLDRILELQQKAIEAAQVKNEEERWLRGLWLHGELAKLDDQGVPEALKVEFMATVKIVLDDVLPLPDHEVKTNSGLVLPGLD